MNFFNLTKQDIFVIRQLAHKDRTRENSSAILGQFWQILNPFINMIVLILIFSTIFENKDFVNYPMYVATGTIIFDIFGFGTKNCIRALSSNKNFLIKAQLKKEIYVKERLYIAIINFIYSFAIYIGLMVFFKIPFRLSALLIIPDIILLIIFVYGFGKILAVITVFFADIEYFHEIFRLFVYYGSALFYSPEKLSHDVQVLLSLNPVYLAIAIARISIIDGKIPHYTLWLKLGIYALIMFWLGREVFKKGTDNIVAKL